MNPIQRKLSIGLTLTALMITANANAAIPANAGRVIPSTAGLVPTVVAVVDTGIDAKHPAFQGRLWTNPGETGLDAQGRDKATNGIDDDGNGFVDDVHGWNFVNGTNDLSDSNGHGTHVAGLIAGPNRTADKAAPKLMVLKYYDTGATELQNLRRTVAAIRYATAMGAKIINYSGGGYGRNADEEAAIAEAGLQGVLFVAAAGNERNNSDRLGYYPADYGLPNILSVAAVDLKGRLIPASNYGEKTVHLAALGDKVLSTIPGGKWGRMTGTSQAAAVAAGVAARLALRLPLELRSPDEIVRRLIGDGIPELSLKGKTRYQVRVEPSILDRI